MYKLISKIDLIKVMFRLFLLEASWNFEKLQNIGFAYTILPIAKRLYADFEGRKEFMKRHLKFFNTHPAMASFITGVVINLEEKMKLGEEIKPDDIENIKNSMMGPLAAIGDNFFWEYLRPFTALVGVIIVMLCRDNYGLAFLGPLVAIFLYNSFGLLVRYLGIIKGYEMGVEIVPYIGKLNLRSLNEKISLMSLILLGATFPAIFVLKQVHLLPASMPPVADNALKSLFMFGLAFLMMAGIKIKITPTVIFYGVIAVAVVSTYIR